MILQKPTPWVVASLLPIVGGVALASVTEASFNWYDIFIYFCFIIDLGFNDTQVVILSYDIWSYCFVLEKGWILECNGFQFVKPVS